MGAFLVSADPEHQGSWKHLVTGLRISSGGEGACGLKGHHAGHKEATSQNLSCSPRPGFHKDLMVASTLCCPEEVPLI